VAIRPVYREKRNNYRIQGQPEIYPLNRRRETPSVYREKRNPTLIWR
jgi:hypothetical protein